MFSPIQRWTGRLAVMAMVALLTPPAAADYAIYTLPGGEYQLMLEGKVTYNPGGTATLRHPRGTLHFSAGDLHVIRAPTPATLFGSKYRTVRRDGNIEEYLKLAQWSLHNGLLDKCKRLLGEAWKIDSSHVRLRKMAGLMRYLNASVPDSQKIRDHLEKTVGGRGLTMTRSRHFLLLHEPNQSVDPQTRKTRAQMRLDLLETVYESYFLTFAFRGKYIRPPNYLLEVVLFDDHNDFLQLERLMDVPVKQLAGFYSPDDNVSVFYDSGNSPQFKALRQIRDDMATLQTAAKANRTAASGQIIRMAKSIDLLIDITRESEDVAVVSHECLHHLAGATSLFPREGNFVRWVHEGLASYFESAKQSRWSGVGVVDRDRIGYYRMLRSDPQRGSIEFIVSDLGFAVEAMLGDQNAAYGQAWALTHFLFNRHFDRLMKYYETITEIPIPDIDPDLPEEELKKRFLSRADKMVEAFDEAFGDRDRLQVEWRRYMSRLRTDLEKHARR